MTVVTLGETMMALRSTGLLRLGGSARTSIAGAETTVAIGLSRLGHSARWVSRLGRDEAGELILRTLRAEGVDVSAVSRDDSPTGLILFEERLPDLVRVQYYRANSAATRLGPDDVRNAVSGEVSLVHLSGITAGIGEGPRAAVEAALDAAAEVGAMVSFDINFRSKLWSPVVAAEVLTPLARRADVVIGSTDELELVGGAESLLAAGVREVVTKLGAAGAMASTADGTVSASGNRVEVVDSIGAGDAFTSGYLSALLDGLPVPERLARGNTCGAFAVSTSGDWEGLPTRSELALLDVEKGEALR
ncbi:sugar kinase [Saccharopolyspora sp. ID03-671]|uniref:sugar kinase n=1 Tax=Saccharopolyspora sp. ID03-671 TaxID=3073066 RepID=UPI00324E4C1F